MTTKFEIEKFNGNNFSLWKSKIKAILTNDKCIATISDKPASVFEEKWVEIEANAMTNLQLALGDTAYVKCL